jgi:hypothetical protein
MWGTLSDEITGLTFTIYNIQYIYMLLHECSIYVQYVQDFCQSRLSAADHAVPLLASAYEFY